MSRRITTNSKAALPAQHGLSSGSARRVSLGKRARVAATRERRSYMPPETWYEPAAEAPGVYTVVEQPAGAGYRHILSEEDIRARLAELPNWMVQPLQVVQISQMTRKKRRAPCYGMQWGAAIYLYPVEDTLVEEFGQPPLPSQLIEARMYGAEWSPCPKKRRWRLVWSASSIRDFYLNNVLIHELGHTLDQRNSNSVDRERYAEWFALEYGYKPSRRRNLAAAAAALYG